MKNPLSKQRKRDAQGRFIPKRGLGKIDWKTDNRIALVAVLAFVFGPSLVASVPRAEYASASMTGTSTTKAKPKPNLVLAAVANRGVMDKSAPMEKGWCQMFNRLRVQNSAAYGPGAYQQYMKPTARETGLAFLKSPYGFPASQLKSRGGLQTGDMVYKTDPANSGGVGHTGINVGRVPGKEHLGPLIAENSSTPIRRINGAKGWRTVKEFGVTDKNVVIVRLPVIEKEKKAPSQ